MCLVERLVVLTESTGALVFSSTRCYRLVEGNQYEITDLYLIGILRCLCNFTTIENYINFKCNFTIGDCDVKQIYKFNYNDCTVILFNGQYDMYTRKLIENIISSQALTSCVNYYQIINQFSDSLLIIDTSGKILLANTTILTMFAYNYIEIIDVNVKQLISEPSLEVIIKHENSLNEKSQNKKDKDRDKFMVKCIKSNGQIFMGSLRRITLQDAYALIIHDDTDHENFKELEKLNISKNTFIASVSHEIRTPLNGIIGMTQLLQEETLNSEFGDKIKIIEECGLQLLELVNDILDYTKIVSDNITLNRSTFNFETILSNTLDCFQTIIIQKKLDFQIEYKLEIPTIIYGDKSRIRQILYNLVGNAIKFTDHGSVTIKVTLTRDDPEMLDISVTDTGCGISEDRLKTLFDPFNSSEQNYTTSDSRGGVGLGLTISRNLAQLMNGQITVVSVPNRGSCFTFRLPYSIHQLDYDCDDVDGVVADVQNEVATARLKDIDINQIKDLSILIVDDDKNARKILEGMLKPCFDKITVVSTPYKLLQVLETNHFDVVITDIIMPGMNGIELVKLVRKLVPMIIGVSSLTDIQGFEKLFDKVIIKPVKKSELIQAIYQLSHNKVITMTAPIKPSVLAPLPTTMRSLAQQLPITTSTLAQQLPITTLTLAQLPIITPVLDSVPVEKMLLKSTNYYRLNPIKTETKIPYFSTTIDVINKKHDSLDNILEDLNIIRVNSQIFESASASDGDGDGEGTASQNDEPMVKERKIVYNKQICLNQSTDIRLKDNSKKILIVEDNNCNAIVIKLFLEKLGYSNTVHVTNGIDALKCVRDEAFDLILMDLKLPYMDGVECSQKILELRPNSYIIIVSACILETDKSKCYAVGIYNFLSKPIKLDELEAFLNDVFKRREDREDRPPRCV